MHTMGPPMDDGKYQQTCHVDDQSMKTFSTNLSVPGCHNPDETDTMQSMNIKTEENVSHSYVLPSFLH